MDGEGRDQKEQIKIGEEDLPPESGPSSIIISRQELSELNEPPIQVSQEELPLPSASAVTTPQPSQRGISKRLIYTLGAGLAVIVVALAVLFGTGILGSLGGGGTVDVEDKLITWVTADDPKVSSYAAALQGNGFRLSPKTQMKVVFRVSMSGEEYTVVKYKSSPVSIQVFDSNSRLVQNQPTVERVLTSYAWGGINNRIPEGERQILITNFDQASELSYSGSSVFKANEVLAQLLGVIDTIDSVKIPLVGSAWDIICTQIGPLCYLEDKVRPISVSLTRMARSLDSSCTSLGEVVKAENQIDALWADSSSIHTTTVDGTELEMNARSAVSGLKALAEDATVLKNEIDDYLEYFRGFQNMLDSLQGIPFVSDIAEGLANLLNQLQAPIIQVSDSLDSLYTSSGKSVDVLNQAISKASQSKDIALKQWKQKP